MNLNYNRAMVPPYCSLTEVSRGRNLVLQRLIALLLLILLPTAAVGAEITLFAEENLATPFVLLPGEVSEPLTFGIRNNVAVDPPSEFLTAWQLRLEILGDTFATGTLQFQSVDEPENYVFESISSFGPSFNSTGNDLFAQDFEFPAVGGVQVPTGLGANLVTVSLQSSADARGSFSVFTLSGLINSQWTDANEPVRRSREFANVPNGSSPVSLVTVLVTSAGDYDRDLDVDGADYLYWQQGNSPDPFSAGDLDAWEANYGTVVATVAPVTAVPEPCSAALLLCAAVFLADTGNTARRRVG